MTHLELAKGLNTFSFEYSKIPSCDLPISLNIQKRVVVSRLYYALYNRILQELPEIATSKGSNKHITVLNILEKQTREGDFYLKLYELFKDLQVFRVWADYTVANDLSNAITLTTLLRKAYRYINSERVIA